MSQTDISHTTIETLLKRTMLLNEEYQQKVSSLLPRHLLQLRKDQESVLKKVLHMHRSLCLALGIDAGKSPEVNIERATHALGTTGLQKKFRLIAHIANLFAEVTAFIERFIDQEKKQKERIKALEGKAEATQEKHLMSEKIEKHDLNQALDLQTQFEHSISQLTQALQRYSSLAEFGLLLNHIGGLQHPNSLFFTNKNAPTLALDKQQLEHQARLARLMPHP